MDSSDVLEWSKSTFAILVLLPRACMTEYVYTIVMHYIGKCSSVTMPTCDICMGTLTMEKTLGRHCCRWIYA